MYWIIEKGHYIDSLESLFATTVLNEQPSIRRALVGRATGPAKLILQDVGLVNEELLACSDADYVIVAEADSQEAFEAAVEEMRRVMKQNNAVEAEESYATVAEAVAAHPKANLCSIAVPGEYALEEVKKALNAGLHCCVFSNNVPLEDERQMKELAREKGLLCMGPDCGVANINGAALVLSSINARGPFGIVGASGTGIQHVAAILHEAGSGVSQTIGTGGNDLKEPVGGLMMLCGIDALEADPETKYIILISRKPAESVLQKVLDRVSRCKKPRVVLFMGCERARIEATGAIWAENLDDCGQKALELIGKSAEFETEAQLDAMAAEAVKGMAPEQKYVRGAFSGGTYMDEAVHAMEAVIGPIYANNPNASPLQLPDLNKSIENTCIDYGEEEFTQGRPHPAIDAGVRKPAILREAADPEVAVILLDFILTPPGHPDPAGYVLDDVRRAQKVARQRGGRIAFVASVLGTTADFQNIDDQRRKLMETGVLVCSTNYKAAQLAAKIIRLKKEIG